MSRDAVGRRASLFVAAGTLTMLVCVALLAFAVARDVDGLVAGDGRHRAQAGADLLVSVGRKLPDLPPRVISNGFPTRVRGALDHAISRGQRDGVLSDLVVWDATGKVVYTAVPGVEGTRPQADPGVYTALAGKESTSIRRDELDVTSGKRTGVLDNYVPLRTKHGQVYAVVEIGIPLAPVRADGVGIRDRIVIILIGGALLVWFLLLPLNARVARAAAAAWIPGRGRAVRACRRALDNDEIELVYQPQQDLVTGEIVSVEALVRWRRDGALASPAAFLPAIESTRAMPQLTDRVVDLALAQLSEWRHAGHRLRMSVNLSATDLGDDDLPGRIAAKLARRGLHGSDLTVEVTETALFADTACAQRVLTALGDQGIDIALDDFGTGHASISRLYGLPVSELKIDRLFVSDPSPRAQAYLAAMIGFGQSVGLRVVAEGIEDAGTLTLLEELGCDIAQGYYISRPVPAAEMDSWLSPLGIPSLVAA
jgi:EAL domain-containing protein (putative c-di-GMP-specific phosphodiesterase class I)